MKPRTLDAEMWVPAGIDAVFSFFSNVANLDPLTPPWLRFQTLTPLPVTLRPGSLIEHRIYLHGVPIHWRTEITAFQPPTLFVDEQRAGPYRLWIHRHDFVEENGGTWIRDHVDYIPRGWILEPLLNRWFVQPDLMKIFRYRHQKIRELLAPGSDSARDRVHTS